jgi:pilus assembly protein CpaF
MLVFGKRTRPPVGLGESARRGPAPGATTPASKRDSGRASLTLGERPAAPPFSAATAGDRAGRPPETIAVAQSPKTTSSRTDSCSAIKDVVVRTLAETIDPAVFARLDRESKGEELRDLLCEIIAMKSIVMTIAEQEELLDDICSRVLAGPRPGPG